MSDGNTPAKLLIIDDGWQCTDVDVPLREPLTSRMVMIEEMRESMEATQDEFIDAELKWLARSAKDLPPSSSAGVYDTPVLLYNGMVTLADHLTPNILPTTRCTSLWLIMGTVMPAVWCPRHSSWRIVTPALMCASATWVCTCLHLVHVDFHMGSTFSQGKSIIECCSAFTGKRYLSRQQISSDQERNNFASLLYMNGLRLSAYSQC